MTTKYKSICFIKRLRRGKPLLKIYPLMIYKYKRIPLKYKAQRADTPGVRFKFYRRQPQPQPFSEPFESQLALEKSFAFATGKNSSIGNLISLNRSQGSSAVALSQVLLGIQKSIASIRSCTFLSILIIVNKPKLTSTFFILSPITSSSG